jgi:putative FmdB family regulatory protein
MPLYDYHCTACKAEFELLVRGSDIPTCPECGSTALEKLVSPIAAHAKSKDIIAAGRRAAAKEGHFSNYSKSERNKLPK